MPDQKISAMTATTTLADTDELVLASTGANKKITGANLKASLSSTTLLSITTLSSNGTFDISSIPQTYNDLILMLIAKGAGTSGSDAPTIRFNADSGANYRRQSFQMWSSNPGYIAASADTGITGGAIPDSSGSYPAGTFGVLEMVIPGYASTLWRKIATYRNFSPHTGSPPTYDIYQDGGFAWGNTAAINRIQVVGSLANFVTGSQLRIYGRL